MSYQALANLLIAQNKLTQAHFESAKSVEGTTDKPNDKLPLLLVKSKICSDKEIAKAFADIQGLNLVAADDYPEASPLPEEVSARFLKESYCVGLETNEQQLTVAVMDPEDEFIKSSLEMLTGKPIMIKVGVASDIQRALDKQYGDGKSQIKRISDDMEDSDAVNSLSAQKLRELAGEAPIKKMVDLILEKALESRASDIHIEPFENDLIVRLRIDGVLQTIEAPSVSSIDAVIVRIKLLAKLNIAERRRPQDGQIKEPIQGKHIDLRVSTIPTKYGESIVIRLLDPENIVHDFKALGFEEENTKALRKILNAPNGIVLITGPTGSGKSTTLHTALRELNTSERKIITVEDPIEYQLKGVNQVQVQPKIDLSFANALRHIVRQDPDIIMIGEMRDLETAQIAVKSALTGHLVLSTLHTNNAASALTRLLDMGLDNYLLADTIRGVLAQRLVRRLCEHCKQPYTPSPEIIKEKKLNLLLTENQQPTLYHATGCKHCFKGYKGRLAIIELLTINAEISNMIITHQEAQRIHEQAVKDGMVTLHFNGLIKALKGLTTLEEVLKVTTTDM